MVEFVELPSLMHTSPNSLCILKLRLLILSCGDPGKQYRQFVTEYARSSRYEAMSDMLEVHDDCALRERECDTTVRRSEVFSLVACSKQFTVSTFGFHGAQGLGFYVTETRGKHGSICLILRLECLPFFVTCHSSSISTLSFVRAQSPGPVPLYP